MATFKSSDFNKKVTFGEVKSVKNPNTGSTQQKFVPALNLWYATKTRTLNQQYQLQGTSLENTNVIIVRHHAALVGFKVAQINEVMFDIVQISPDESNNYITYDFVTLKRRT